ncbi:hypothetical protein I79_025137 [Cricetulus griseus]|uniref:Uncharacterized protein n=1 Tax=Cricetulus griseus TaxID=10029 RepID=G3IMJ7_CRIGR|nr:hypothetical protein I79_025137 [Cricetulus griseus]
MEEPVQKTDDGAHDPRAHKYMGPWRIRTRSRVPKPGPLFVIRGTEESHYMLRGAGLTIHHQTRINSQNGGPAC